MEINKILKKDEVSKEILNLANKKNCAVIEAVLLFCEERNLEYETISKLLTSQLKEMIEIEAEKLNMVKKTKERLDL